ncbi:MAG: hypothetical protein Q9159_003282 [Coniocarpon cinnabarinum]
MEDYEREAAKEWQEVGQRKKRAPVQRKHVVKAEFQQDSQALIQWRERQMPTKIVHLPKEFIQVNKFVKKGRPGGRIGTPTTTLPELITIARETETEIFQTVDFATRNKQPQLKVSIYGSNEAAEQALMKIKIWKQSYVPEKPGRSADWARVENVGTPEHRDADIAKMMEEEQRESFRRDPEENVIFPAAGKLVWDMSYSSPSEVLGTRFEACDSLRTEYRCFIVPDKQHEAVLRIYGDDNEKVKRVINRLRGSYFQAISRDKANRNGSEYLFNRVPRKSLCCRVAFETLFERDPGTGNPSVALGARALLETDQIDNIALQKRAMRAEELPAENARRLNKATGKALHMAKYFRGNLRMRATFGIFLLKKFRQTSDFEEFEDMMSEGDQVDGDVDADIARVNGSVMKKFVVNPCVVNLHGLRGPNDLPKPTYSTRFLLKHKSEGLDLKFDAEFDYDEDNDYVHIFAKRWSRNIHAPGYSVKLLDVCLVDLNKGSDAWSIDIDALESVPSNRAPELIEFADKVNLNVKIATSVDTDKHKAAERYIDFEAIPGVVVHFLVQKKHWTFEYGRSGYLIDVVKGEEFSLRNPNSAKPRQDDLVHNKPKWRVSIYRKSWDVDLAENAHLQLGEGMRGHKTVADFFPASKPSNPPLADVGHFLRILNEVRNIIRDPAIEW